METHNLSSMWTKRLKDAFLLQSTNKSLLEVTKKLVANLFSKDSN